MSNPYAPPSSGERPAPAGSPPERSDAAPGTTSGPDAGPGPWPAESDYPGGPGGPGGKVPPRPPDPVAVREASRRVLHFGLLMLTSLVTASLPFPWQAAALVFAVAALVIGVRALVAVWRAGLRGALVPVLAIGLFFAAMLSASLTMMLALWPIQVENQQCLRDALTISAREACAEELQDSLDEVIQRATTPRD